MTISSPGASPRAHTCTSEREDPPCSSPRASKGEAPPKGTPPGDAETKGSRDRAVLEKVMAAYGHSLSKFWFVIAPLVVAMLIAFNAGWSQAEMNSIPFESLWSPRDGRLAKEWKYYEANVVKPARDWYNRVSYVDKSKMGKGSPMTGAGGNILTAESLDEMLQVHELFYDVNVTTSSGTTYFGRDLCERPGTDAPGPTPKDGADTSADGVGATNLTGAWQDQTGVPGFLVLGEGALVTDQHRANAYYAFQGLECPMLLGGTQEQQLAAGAKWDELVLIFPKDIQADQAQMAVIATTVGASLSPPVDPYCLLGLAAQDVTLINGNCPGGVAYTVTAEAEAAGVALTAAATEAASLPENMMAYSFNQLFGAEAAATTHLASTGLGGVPLMSHGTLCSALMVGFTLSTATAIANALPAAKMPCQILSVLDCFAETKTVQDPVYANFLDPMLYNRADGKDMPGTLLDALGSAEPAGFSTKPAWTNKTTAEIGEVISEPKYRRYANRTELLPDALHPMAYLAPMAALDPSYAKFGQPLASASWANCADGEVAVYKRPACGLYSDVDGCRLRVADDTDFTADPTGASWVLEPPPLKADETAPDCDPTSTGYESAACTVTVGTFLADYAADPNAMKRLRRCTAAPCVGVLPPNDPAASILDPYVLSTAFLDDIAEYECVVPEAAPDEAKAGCQYFATIASWDPFQMHGNTYTNDTSEVASGVITAAPFALDQFFMGSTLSVLARRAVTFPATTEADVEEAKGLFALEFDRRLLQLRKTTEAVYINPATDGYFKRLTEEANKVPWAMIGLGFVLVIVTVVVTSWRPGKVLHSRVELLLQCCSVVLLSLSGAMGGFAWWGLCFNQTMVAVLPFLGLAIGIDDCFILVRYFDAALKEHGVDASAQTILSATMRGGGASVTLTSWCNVVAFSLGYMIDVPGLADFCVGAALVALVDWICMMTLVPTLLLFELKRIQHRRHFLPTNFLWFLKSSDLATSEESVIPPKVTWEGVLTSRLADVYVPFLGRPAVTALVATVSVAWFVCGVYFSEGDPLMPLGFVPHDVAQTGSPSQYYLQTFTEHYDAYPIEFFSKDLDYPNQQQELVELMGSLLELEDIGPYPTDSWLTQFSSYVFAASMGQLGLRQTDVYDADCLAPGAEVATAGCTPGCPAGAVPNFEAAAVPVEVAPGVCMDQPNPFYCPMNTSYTHPTFLPYGMVAAKCFYGLLSLFASENISSDPGNQLPFFPPAGATSNTPNGLAAIGGLMNINRMRRLDNSTDRFITAGVQISESGDDQGYVCLGYDPADPATSMLGEGCLYYLQSPLNDGSVGNPIILAQWTLYMNGMRGANGNDEQVKTIKKVRDLIAASPLADKVFPQNEAFTFGEINVELRDIFQRAFAIDVGVIALIAIVFLQSVTAGLLTAAATAFIVYEVYFAMGGLVHFNMITAACLLMSVGISVEFTAHLIACYTMETRADATPVAKLKHAIVVVAPPLLLGALSTFLGNVPLAFSNILYVQKYFFRTFSLIVAIGALNALLFLPAKLMAQTAIGQAAARMLGKGKAPKGKAPPPKDGMVDLTVGMDRITGAGGDRGSIGRPERSMSGVV